MICRHALDSTLVREQGSFVLHLLLTRTFATPGESTWLSER
jgi:hypothetical protein